MRGLEEGVVIGQFLHLPRGDIGQFLAPIADVDAPKPGHAVDDFIAVAVGQHDPRCPRDHPRALFAKGAIGAEGMHVMGRIDGLQFGRGQVVGDLVHGDAPNGPAAGHLRHAMPFAPKVQWDLIKFHRRAGGNFP